MVRTKSGINQHRDSCFKSGSLDCYMDCTGKSTPCRTMLQAEVRFVSEKVCIHMVAARSEIVALEPLTKEHK